MYGVRNRSLRPLTTQAKFSCGFLAEEVMLEVFSSSLMVNMKAAYVTSSAWKFRSCRRALILDPMQSENANKNFSP